MKEIRETVGSLDGAGKRFAVVASRFNGRLVDALVTGAVDCLVRHQVAADAIQLVRVPGAWELPLAAREVAQAGGIDALVALGVLIRGETPHFDVLAAETARGLGEVARDHRLPVGFGVLTCDSPEQAAERAGGKAGNKGWEAALAALELADVFARLRGGALP
jgi:6,7-dimethyl-8-ribityllumazine synthase